MFVLIKTIGDTCATAIAASENKNILRKELRKDAKKILKEYYDDPDDEYGQSILAEQFESLDALKGDNWDDGDEECRLSYEIQEVPCID